MAQIRPVILGEVLFDCFPDGTRVLGGAPFNVAWHLQALGLSPVLISRVGSDSEGSEILKTMSDWGMDTSHIQTDRQHPTGKVEIRFENGEPSYGISPDEAYGQIEYSHLEPSGTWPLLYHGTLALYNPQVRNVVNRLHQEIELPIFIDVNLRPPWWSRDSVTTLMKRATWIKLNEAELQELSQHNGTISNQAEAMVEELQLRAMILTKGDKGAQVFLKGGNRTDVVPDTTASVVDSVGAGDAFSSIFIMGIVSGWSVEKTLHRAQELASAIVTKRGAIVRDRTFYTQFLKEWAATEQP